MCFFQSDLQEKLVKRSVETGHMYSTSSSSISGSSGGGVAATTGAINIPLSQPHHTDTYTNPAGDSDEEGNSNFGVNGDYTAHYRPRLDNLHGRNSISRVTTTEETVSSSQSSSSPHKGLSSCSVPPPPPMTSSLSQENESDENSTMIDSLAREIHTDDTSLVRPYDHSDERAEPFIPITRESSKFENDDLKGEEQQSPQKGENAHKEEVQNDSTTNDAEVSTEADPDKAPSEVLDIAKFPTAKLLEMLTALLDKIVKSNDRLADANPSLNQERENITISNSSQTNHGYLKSVLSFRGKHIPQITLEHYFQRIQKYCPTTNDVFLSLLVYFDRISKRCNSSNNNNSGGINQSTTQQQQAQAFVMDSHNIHRLLIAGVTVSTKFFSDFFYSNSRYARVGGISLQELNHLELQFLVLCDFELLISVNELQRYADLLYKFWNNSPVVEKETDAPSPTAT